MKAQDYIQQLQLLPHPEGGYYRETYRSDTVLLESATDLGFNGDRQLCTAIYFLIEKDNFSALHRIKSDEIWHFYGGDALEVIEIDEAGQLICTAVGPNITAGQVPQYLVKAGRWFGSRVLKGGSFSFVGCTVAPGFDFRDFEMASRESLLTKFPEYREVISELTRL
jgi:hypothetical protein